MPTGVGQPVSSICFTVPLSCRPTGVLFRVMSSTHQELGYSEGGFQEILDAIPDHIMIFGHDGSRLYTNQVTLDYHGSTFEQWRQEETVKKLIHPDDLNRVSSEWD